MTSRRSSPWTPRTVGTAPPPSGRPTTGHQAVRDYVTQAFADEQRIDDVRFGTPVAQRDQAVWSAGPRFLGQQGMAMTLAGCAMARFDADGLTTQARDDRHLQATNG
jgi:hypothetical protein